MDDDLFMRPWMETFCFSVFGKLFFVWHVNLFMSVVRDLFVDEICLLVYGWRFVYVSVDGDLFICYSRLV